VAETSADEQLLPHSQCPADLQSNICLDAGKIPLTQGKAGSSWDVAQLVTFLCSHGARHITGSQVPNDCFEPLLKELIDVALTHKISLCYSQMWIDGGESLLAG
jgi:hypothetical protein